MQTLKRLTVRDACSFDPNPSLIVGPDEDFAEIIQRFATLPELRGIFVVDNEKHLLGVITRTDLLDWARVKIGDPVEMLSTPVEDAIRLISLMRASTVGQFMRPDSHCSAVKLDDSLAYALRLMIKMNLIVLPVVDEANRVVEDLKLSELLALAIQEGEHQ
jgi:CBS domain-containing protein